MMNEQYFGSIIRFYCSNPYYSIYTKDTIFVSALVGVVDTIAVSLAKVRHLFFVNIYALFESRNEIVVPADIIKQELAQPKGSFVEQLVQETPSFEPRNEIAVPEGIVKQELAKQDENLKFKEVNGSDADSMFLALIAAAPESNSIKGETGASLRACVSSMLEIDTSDQDFVLDKFKNSLENTGFRGLGTEDFRTELRKIFFQESCYKYYDRDKILNIIEGSLDDAAKDSEIASKKLPDLIEMLSMEDTGMSQILNGNSSFEKLFEENADKVWEAYKEEIKKTGGIRGDQMMMRILANMFNLKVIIHNQDGSIVEGACSEEDKKATKVHLQYTDRRYNALVVEKSFVEKVKQESLEVVEVPDDGDCMFHALIAAAPESNPINQKMVEELRKCVSEILNKDNTHKNSVLTEFKDSLENTGFRGLGTEDFRTELRKIFFQESCYKYYDRDKILNIIERSLGEYTFASLEVEKWWLSDLIAILDMDTGMNQILRDNCSFDDVFFNGENAYKVWEVYRQEVEKLGGIWGDQVTLEILANMFNLKVIIHNQDGSIVVGACSGQENPTEVHLQYTGVHYNALVVEKSSHYEIAAAL